MVKKGQLLLKLDDALLTATAGNCQTTTCFCRRFIQQKKKSLGTADRIGSGTGNC